MKSTHLALLFVVILLSSSVSAGRRSGGRRGNRRRGLGSIMRDFFGQVDWFEAVDGRNDDCVPDANTNTVAPPVDEGQEGEFDNFRRKEKDQFFSLATVTVCSGESIGTEKCICWRAPWGRLFNLDYKLKCGTCQMNFEPEDRSNNDDEADEAENGFRRRAGLIKLDEDAVELKDEGDKFI